MTLLSRKDPYAPGNRVLAHGEAATILRNLADGVHMIHTDYGRMRIADDKDIKPMPRRRVPVSLRITRAWFRLRYWPDLYPAVVMFLWGVAIALAVALAPYMWAHAQTVYDFGVFTHSAVRG
ncbi:hypothetical protein CSC70_03935 [Pseudoxanthomonas kalamensis DSM 18571]|uniref:hypothetical protein n=1 Tax=Pseudoxanthomonas kalamensis TaxID=289483 RepID=UPI00139099F8|nr:hypothetical protein [Pseudoxanthomonas kalamensis]KAF1711086.1 hypothetical protein CSC70_03935 [Pseudoxanthomonas kalamensis DSM 18571]